MAKELSWKAKRNGNIYCAPACGGKCTWEMYLKAKERGEHCARELGKGWTVRVSENLGWYATVLSPCRRIKVSVHPVTGAPVETLMGTLNTYTAFLGDADDIAGGTWAEHGDTPAEAVNAVVATARAALSKMNARIHGLPYWKGKQRAS